MTQFWHSTSLDTADVISTTTTSSVVSNLDQMDETTEPTTSLDSTSVDRTALIVIFETSYDVMTQFWHSTSLDFIPSYSPDIASIIHFDMYGRSVSKTGYIKSSGADECARPNA